MRNLLPHGAWAGFWIMAVSYLVIGAVLAAFDPAVQAALVAVLTH